MFSAGFLLPSYGALKVLNHWTFSNLTMPDIILCIIIIHLGCHWSKMNLDIIILHTEDTAHLCSPWQCFCKALQFSIPFLKYDSMQCNNSRCKLAMDLYQWHIDAFWFAFYYFLSGLPFTFLATTKQWTYIFMALVIQSVIIHAVYRVSRDNLVPARWQWMQETITLCEVKKCFFLNALPDIPLHWILPHILFQFHEVPLQFLSAGLKPLSPHFVYISSLCINLLKKEVSQPGPLRTLWFLSMAKNVNLVTF